MCNKRKHFLIKALFLISMSYVSCALLASGPAPAAKPQSSSQDEQQEVKSFTMRQVYSWPTDPEDLAKKMSSLFVYPKKIWYTRPDGSGFVTDGTEFKMDLSNTANPHIPPEDFPTVQEAQEVTGSSSKPIDICTYVLLQGIKRSQIKGFFDGKKPIEISKIPGNARDKAFLDALSE